MRDHALLVTFATILVLVQLPAAAAVQADEEVTLEDIPCDPRLPAAEVRVDAIPCPIPPCPERAVTGASDCIIVITEPEKFCIGHYEDHQHQFYMHRHYVCDRPGSGDD